MPILNKCCCCIDLRTGGIILGSLSLIGALINLTQGIIVLKDIDRLENLLEDACFESTMTTRRALNWTTIPVMVVLAMSSVLMIVGSHWRWFRVTQYTHIQ